MNCWAFVANPKTYRIQEKLRADTEGNWTVNDHRVLRGDRALIWKAKAYEPNRGIVALADVISDPTEMADGEDKYWVNPQDAKRVAKRVHVRFEVTSVMPLWEISNPFLQKLSVARSTGGGIFVITPRQWDTILELCGLSQ